MKRIIVNDSSCLIDLRKGGLLPAALLLPFHFVVALPLVAAELHDFTEADWEDLRARKLEIVDLAPDALAVRSLFGRHTSSYRSMTAFAWHSRRRTKIRSS